MQEILKHPHLQRLNEAFSEAGFQLRLVGGCVRDMMRGEVPKDIDLCTDATPDEMMALAETNEFAVIATGLKHGTLTFVFGREMYEITTLRVDVATDGRHAEVEFTTSFEQDAERRDLTINAMSMDFDGVLYDYFGGAKDLQANTVRFVGNARERIREDYLRILRYFRFMARFDAKMDFVTLDVIADEAKGLERISVERIWVEMQKLVTYPAAARILLFMQVAGVTRAIGLPEIDYRIEDADCAEAAIASFFVGLPEDAVKFCKSWKMSVAETKKIEAIAHMANEMWSTAVVENFINIYDMPRDWIVSAITLRYGKNMTKNDRFMVDYARNYQKVEFPVKGQDLLDAGMKPGPEVGRKLHELKRRWWHNRFSETREELLAQVTA